MASDNINVSTLLRKLEKLKQKKARNLNKLKHKKGRSVILNLNTDDVSSNSDSNDPSFPYQKTEVSNSRKVFGELNQEDCSNRNEVNYSKDGILWKEKNETAPAIGCDYSTQKSIKLDGLGEDLMPIKKRLENESQSDNQFICYSKYEKYHIKDSDNDQFVGRKRSATEFQSDNKTISFSKKSKLADDEFSDVSKEQNICLEVDSFTDAERKYKLSEKLESPISVDCDTKCLEENVLTSTEIEYKLSKILESPISVDCDKKNSILDNNLTHSVVNKSDELKYLLLNSKDLPFEDKILLEDNASSNSNEMLNVVPVDAGAIQNLLIEKNCDEETTLSKSSPSTVKDTKTNCEINECNNDCDDYPVLVQCDSNVIEVADTEAVIARPSQRDISNIENCDPLITTDYVIFRHSEKNLLNEEANCTINEIAETEEFTNKDFPTEVAGFEEVTTQVSIPVPLVGSLSDAVRHPSINCTFTDEEDETAELENSFDVDKLLVGEDESDENEIENENLSPLETDSNDSNSYSEQKQSNHIFNDIKEVTKNVLCTVTDIAIDSEILVIPETELFDFASYSNNQVDDIAQNISIETDNAGNYNAEMCVDESFNACIGTDCDIDSNKEPVFFIDKINNDLHDDIEVQNAINCDDEQVSIIIKDDDKGMCSEISKAIIDCNESGCKKAEINEINPNTCVEIENVNNCKEDPELEVRNLPGNACDSMQNFEEVKDSEKLSSQNEFETDSFGTEDFLKLVDLQQMPFSSDSLKSSRQSDQNIQDSLDSSLKFQCCFQSDVQEEVTQLKLCYFNNSYYLFIQHHTWIQVWRQESESDWMKIYAHQVDDLQLKELCLSQSESYLILVMLLNSKQSQKCLQFLVFERESRLIKLMEHTHWFENSESEDVLLCGLDDLRFASAQGIDDAFKVYSHSFSCLENNPRLLTVSLGSAADLLHSLCRIDKLPNALLGVSKTMLYVWHLLEARLVTSVRLHTEDLVSIENCVWTTVENGLVFLMATHMDKESARACQLLAANLATGFCEVVQTYTLQPAKEASHSNRKINLVYSEPFIAATSQDGAFLWSIDDEYCCASLMSSDYSSIAILATKCDSFLVVVGCNGGCVNCYEIKYNR